jgi:hypothetical protein
VGGVVGFACFGFTAAVDFVAAGCSLMGSPVTASYTRPLIVMVRFAMFSMFLADGHITCVAL